ncbi:phosphatidylinositol-glycan biosynthesis class W protein [Pseudophryne corroboree]|uniref:phosphatidylinositol-glycan biosynthesis class W protein n=1 Tax=Pseudophryne corroboree TaxID=495146 RepID=UPI0030816DC6
MSEKQLKEAFVSNLNGTSIEEISLGSSVATLCMLYRGLMYIYIYQKIGDFGHSWKWHFILDFVLLVLPQVLSCTVLSDHLYLVPICVATLSFLLFHTIYIGRKSYKNKSPLSICKSFLNAQLENRTVPAVTFLRVFINVVTAISILAVDFPIFPRRYAKTETYGTGVMDIGVGCFIFANAIVSPEARSQGDVASKSQRVIKQLMSVWPLLLLGFGRLISVKATEYHEHTSEYGIHWNFFFTLAIVRVLSAALFTLIPPQKIWIVAAVIISFYQFLLEMTNLKGFILHGSDGKDTRVGFINANREGIFSSVGYIAIYMVGIQVGLYILKKRMFVKEWITPIYKLAIISLLLFMGCTMLQIYVEPISRRMANLPFCMWVVAQCMAWLCLILLCDLILVFARYLTPGSSVPSTWNIYHFSKENITTLRDSKKEIHLCLIKAINRNQLLFFLLSNIMTGMVNMLIDTIHSNNLFSLFILITYMFINCLIAFLLHINNITIKWW